MVEILIHKQKETTMAQYEIETKKCRNQNNLVAAVVNYVKKSDFLIYKY